MAIVRFPLDNGRYISVYNIQESFREVAFSAFGKPGALLGYRDRQNGPSRLYSR